MGITGLVHGLLSQGLGTFAIQLCSSPREANRSSDPNCLGCPSLGLAQAKHVLGVPSSLLRHYVLSLKPKSQESFMPEPNESADEIWELAEFCAREAMLLRSFVEYLRTWPHPAEKKMERLQNWKQEIGLLLGNMSLSDSVSRLFQRLRAAPPEARKAILQKALESMYSSYFFGSF
jgi:hypothetical protein